MIVWAVVWARKEKLMTKKKQKGEKAEVRCGGICVRKKAKDENDAKNRKDQ